jgi:hypothetical protein
MGHYVVGVIQLEGIRVRVGPYERTDRNPGGFQPQQWIAHQPPEDDHDSPDE